MKILLVHNSYQQYGGEEAVFGAERSLLILQGHSVIAYQRHNDELCRRKGLTQFTAGPRTIWASDSYRAIRDLALREKPDVAHFHNTFPLISPAGYYACREAGVPVVQTLHNYRLFCPLGTFLRDDKVCESCLKKMVPWPGVVHACYRGSRAATGAVAAMLTAHRLLRTWTEKVDVYIALSEFARKKFIEGGLPASKIEVKPNFIHPDPGDDSEPDDYALFVGRLSPEKGLGTLLVAWQRLGNRIPIRVLGDGPLRAQLEAQAHSLWPSNVRFEGRVDGESVFAALKRARFLVFPSEWYESFPMALVEAFSCGVPVIASRLGAMQEIVEDGRTGLLFRPGDPEDLAAKVGWALMHREEMREMGEAGRGEFEAKYTADRNYELLMGIYEIALKLGQRDRGT